MGGPFGGRFLSGGNMSIGRDALLSVFDRIYVINLSHRTDRRDETASELRRFGLDFSHPKVTLFSACSFDEAGEWPSKGARGCFESHLGVLRAHLNSADERVLLLEDDISFRADLPASIAAEAGFLRGPWDMLYATHSFGGSDSLVPIQPDRAIVTAHALGISRRMAELAVPYLEAVAARTSGDPAGGPMPVDGAYCWLRAAYPDLNVQGVPRAFAVQRPSVSDIAPGKWVHRLPFWKLASKTARRLRKG